MIYSLEDPINIGRLLSTLFCLILMRVEEGKKYIYLHVVVSIGVGVVPTGVDVVPTGAGVVTTGAAVVPTGAGGVPTVILTDVASVASIGVVPVTGLIFVTLHGDIIFIYYLKI